MYLHSNITWLREQKGITNRKMAVEMGVSSKVAYEIEHKESDGTRLLTVIKVAEYFGVSLDDLIYKDLSKDNK